MGIVKGGWREGLEKERGREIISGQIIGFRGVAYEPKLPVLGVTCVHVMARAFLCLRALLCSRAFILAARIEWGC